MKTKALLALTLSLALSSIYGMEPESPMEMVNSDLKRKAEGGKNQRVQKKHKNEEHHTIEEFYAEITPLCNMEFIQKQLEEITDSQIILQPNVMQFFKHLARKTKNDSLQHDIEVHNKFNMYINTESETSIENARIKINEILIHIQGSLLPSKARINEKVINIFNDLSFQDKTKLSYISSMIIPTFSCRNHIKHELSIFKNLPSDLWSVIFLKMTDKHHINPVENPYFHYFLIDKKTNRVFKNASKTIDSSFVFYTTPPNFKNLAIHFPGLTALDISNASVGDEFLVSLSSFTRLKELNVISIHDSEDSICDYGINQLSYLTNLTSLKLINVNHKIENKTFFLDPLTQLRTLDLENLALDYELSPHISQLTNLQNLNAWNGILIDNPKESKSIMKQLQNLTALKNLNIAIEDRHKNKLLKSLPNCAITND